MNTTVTLDTIREALKRMERHQHTAVDVVLVREWIAHLEAMVATQAQKIAELKTRESELIAQLAEEA